MKILSKISSLVAPSRNVTAKVRSFSELPNFFGSFFSFFLPGPSPWRAVRVTFPLESGCKSSAVKHNFQTFSTLFFRNFLGEIDNRILISDVSHKLFFGLLPHVPGHSWENTGTGVRKRSQSPSESTPILPGKYSSTSRKKLEYSPKRTGNGYGIATATIRIYAPVSLDCHNRYPDLPIIPILDDP